MSATWQSILVGGFSGAASAIITYLLTRSKMRLELAAEYDRDLRKRRLEAYKKLWELLEPLARYGRTTPLTYAELRMVSDQTREWYFKIGGIFLTQSSRDPYFEWKRQMEPVLVEGRSSTSSDGKPSAAQVDAIVGAASALRTVLSDDIGTKKRSFLWLSRRFDGSADGGPRARRGLIAEGSCA